MHINIIYTCTTRKKKKRSAFNKEVVKDLIDITIFLASNGLAFRGLGEGWKDRNKGNFLSLVDLFLKRSLCMAAYTSKLQNLSKKSHVSFISKFRQNQLIDSVAESILTVIQTDVKYARFFSISIDSTFDASRKVQVAFVIRYGHNKTSIIFSISTSMFREKFRLEKLSNRTILRWSFKYERTI